MDQASEASYITENVLQFLGLKRKSVMASTSGLGGVKTGNITKKKYSSFGCVTINNVGGGFRKTNPNRG